MAGQATSDAGPRPATLGLKSVFAVQGCKPIRRAGGARRRGDPCGREDSGFANGGVFDAGGGLDRAAAIRAGLYIDLEDPLEALRGVPSVPPKNGRPGGRPQNGLARATEPAARIGRGRLPDDVLVNAQSIERDVRIPGVSAVIHLEFNAVDAIPDHGPEIVAGFARFGVNGVTCAASEITEIG